MSPDQKFVAVGNARGAGGTPSPLKVFSTIGLTYLATDWHVGAVAFTADSSRVLVVDDTDRFRWFKLQAGKADAKPEVEWAFNQPPTGRNAQLMGISGDGGVVLFHGQPPQRGQSVHLLNGKTGEVMHSFAPKRYLGTAGSVSEDGKLVVLVRDDGTGSPRAVEVRDVRGTLIGAAKIPPTSPDAAVAVSWKARAVVVYDRAGRKLTAYELPAVPAP